MPRGRRLQPRCERTRLRADDSPANAAHRRKPTADGNREPERREKRIYTHMATKLWDKGFEPDKMIEEYTVGDDRELDMRLARYDVAGLAGAYRHARNDRAADGRRTGKADGGTERDRRRDRGRTLRNRTRHRGCPLAGGADAHAPPGRRRQENPLGPLAQRPGAGRPQTVPARRTAPDRRSRKNGVRPPARRSANSTRRY